MPSKSNPGNYFEDFSLGQSIEHAGGRTITEGDSAAYLALTGDRFPLYCDAGFARSLGYARELINDLLVFHIVFGKSVPDISLNAVANLGYADVRFRRPVYAGDTLRVTTEVIGKKENSNGKNGNVYVKTRGVNQDNQAVLEFFRWVMVRKKDPSTNSGENDVPDLPKSVDPNSLRVDSELDASALRAVAKTGRWHFEDYEVGERILHGPGMTIGESEHALATRLYQNIAHVHFDGLAMKDTPAGKRLMYGGHVISVARAMSFNGFENGLRILAWNGGTHVNPMYGGDTLYAFSNVLECVEVQGRDDVGALRLRLVGLKDLDPANEDIEIQVGDEVKGRAAYHPNVVLDLDYYLLMPKRGAN